MKPFKYITLLIAIGALSWCQVDLTTVGTIENDEFYELRKVAVSKSGIFILDVGNKTVFQYSLNGEYQSTISEPGQGPGEFIEPVSILADKDTLWILGHTLMRIGTFVKGQFEQSIQMDKMPVSFCIIANQFVVGEIFSSRFLARYSTTGTLLDSASFQGAAKKKFNGAPFPLFSALTHMTSSDSHIYLTYEYKNAVEKYDPNLKLIKSKKISRKIKEPQVKEGLDNSWYIDGDAIAKDIQYDHNRVYVLWLQQKLQVDCEGLSRISVFDEDLKHLYDLDLPDCVIGFDVFDGRLYGLCNEPIPRVVIYALD